MRPMRSCQIGRVPAGHAHATNTPSAAIAMRALHQQACARKRGLEWFGRGGACDYDKARRQTKPGHRQISQEMAWAVAFS